jgi:hypothetical protein
MARRKKVIPIDAVKPEEAAGRMDILLMRAAKRVVENTNDPAISKLYDRFSPTINTLIADLFKGARA